MGAGRDRPHLETAVVVPVEDGCARRIPWLIGLRIGLQRWVWYSEKEEGGGVVPAALLRENAPLLRLGCQPGRCGAGW